MSKAEKPPAVPEVFEEVEVDLQTALRLHEAGEPIIWRSPEERTAAWKRCFLQALENQLAGQRDYELERGGDVGDCWLSAGEVYLLWFEAFAYAGEVLGIQPGQVRAVEVAREEGEGDDNADR